MEFFSCWIYPKNLYKISKLKMLSSENIDKTLKYGRFWFVIKVLKHGNIEF
jgi:hypothetical protein